MTNLTEQQLDVLQYILENNGVTKTDLFRRFGIEEGKLPGYFLEISRAGYFDVQVSSSNGVDFLVTVYITPTGRIALSENYRPKPKTSKVMEFVFDDGTVWHLPMSRLQKLYDEGVENGYFEPLDLSEDEFEAKHFLKSGNVAWDEIEHFMVLFRTPRPADYGSEFAVYARHRVIEVDNGTD